MFLWTQLVFQGAGQVTGSVIQDIPFLVAVMSEARVESTIWQERRGQKIRKLHSLCCLLTLGHSLWWATQLPGAHLLPQSLLWSPREGVPSGAGTTRPAFSRRYSWLSSCSWLPGANQRSIVRCKSWAITSTALACVPNDACSGRALPEKWSTDYAEKFSNGLEQCTKKTGSLDIVLSYCIMVKCTEG